MSRAGGKSVSNLQRLPARSFGIVAITRPVTVSIDGTALLPASPRPTGRKESWCSGGPGGRNSCKKSGLGASGTVARTWAKWR